MWHKLSFIPWHSDKDSYDAVRFAATLYLNKEWDDNWGGLFLYKKTIAFMPNHLDLTNLFLMIKIMNMQQVCLPLMRLLDLQYNYFGKLQND